MRKNVQWLSAALLLLPAAGGGRVRAEEGELWRRHPHLIVPRLPEAPVIDGEVDRAEWLAAAELGPLKLGREGGVADETERRVFVGFDEKCFYVAFRLYRPRGALEPLMPVETGRVDSTGLGDFVELMFAPDLDFDRGYSLWLYANGAFGDARLTRNKDKNWDTEWRKAARPTEFGWEGEVAVPFAAFGLVGPPGADRTWGFDFVDNHRTPFKLIAHWACRGPSWGRYENFGRLRFGRRSPAVRFLRAGYAGGKQLAVEFAVANAAGQPAVVEAALDLYRRRKGADGGPMTYYANVDSGLSKDEQAEYTKTTKLDEMARFAMRFYEKVDVASSKRVVEVPAGERRSAGFVRPAEAGEYLLAYQFTSGRTRLAAGVSTFRIEPPLALMLEPYWLYSKLIDVTADLRKLEFSGRATAEFSILGGGSGDERPLARTTTAVAPGAAKATGAVPVGDLRPGFYRVEAALIGADGKELARNSEAIEKPEVPPWFGTDLGNRIEVPEPWTPVEVNSAGKVSVWGRTYDLGRLFPKSAVSQGDELLVSPVKLQVIRGGRELTWSVRRLKLESSRPGKAVYRAALDSDSFSLTGTATVEFDGLIWYDLKMAPKRPGAKVDRVRLTVDFNPRHAELMDHHKFLVDPALGGARQPKPKLNGGAGVLRDSLIPFTPYLWIGDETGGLGFVAEAPIDWIVTEPDAVMETIACPPPRGRAPRGPGRPAGMRINIVDAPTEITRPMRLQFGLQATPIRPLPPRHEVLNIYIQPGPFVEEERYRKLAEAGCRVIQYYYHWRGDMNTEMGGTPERPRDPEQQRLVKEGVRLAHKYGMKVMLVTGWGVNATSDNWKKYGYELGAYPTENKGWGTFCQSAGFNGGYIDYMAWSHADLAREYEVDGVLYDSTANLSPDRNLRIGNAWIDDQGRVRPRYAVLATRDLYRRIYNIYKGEVRRGGVIYNHGGSMWPINVFADMLNRGEGRPMKAKTLRESWIPFEDFRAAYSGEPFGILFSGENNDFMELPMRVSTHLSVFLLHGNYPKEYSIYNIERRPPSYEYERRPINHLWKIFDWLPYDQETTRFMYYRDQKAAVAEQDSLYSSCFVSGDRKRALVVVSNLDTEPVPGAVVRLDRAGMGLARTGIVHVEDAMLGDPVPLKNSTVTIDIDRERYRLLKVWVE